MGPRPCAKSSEALELAQAVALMLGPEPTSEGAPGTCLAPPVALGIPWGLNTRSIHANKAGLQHFMIRLGIHRPPGICAFKRRHSKLFEL